MRNKSVFSCIDGLVFFNSRKEGIKEEICTQIVKKILPQNLLLSFWRKPASVCVWDINYSMGKDDLLMGLNFNLAYYLPFEHLVMVAEKQII